MKKKVLMIVKGFEKTGISSVILSYIDNINIDQFSIDVLTGSSYADDYKNHVLECDSKFFEIPNRDRNILKYILNVAKIVKKEKYEIVHVHGNSSMIWPELLGAWLGGCKVRIAHSHNTTCNHIKLDQIFRPIFSLLCTTRLSCGEEAGKWMFGDEKFTVIPNGVDENKFCYSLEIRNQVREGLGIDSNDILLGHVGCFNYQKNHRFMMALMERIVKVYPQIKLLLVGEGEYFSEIKDEVINKNLTNNVILYGISNNVPALLMAMDVFLLPSRFEGLPCVLVEAQISGLPCIVSDHVSIEAKMSDYYSILPISDEAFDKWIDEIHKYSSVQREQIINSNTTMVCNRGYFISDCVSLLESVYSKSV